MERRWAVVFSVVIVFAVALPVGLPRDRDSFPLSFYPMYAGDRPSITAVPSVVLRTDNNERQRLSIEVIANTDDPLIAASLLRRAISAAEADVLCREIARRASDLGTIEVVTERHDLVAFAAGSVDPLSVEVHARCTS